MLPRVAPDPLMLCCRYFTPELDRVLDPPTHLRRTPVHLRKMPGSGCSPAGTDESPETSSFRAF